MKKVTYSVSSEIVLLYDENSPEFQEALASYNDLIHDGDADDMLRYVAGQLGDGRNHFDLIEGVGYVALEGAPLPEKDYAGIIVKNHYDDLQFERLD